MDISFHDSYMGARYSCCSKDLQLKNKLRELRLIDSVSQAEMGEILGVSRQTINSIENGKYDPSLPLAFKISKFFKLKIEDVFIPN